MSLNIIKSVFIASALSLIVASSLSFAKHHNHKKDTLYHRLGGKTAIKAVVNDFVGNCAGDERIKDFFAPFTQDSNESRAKLNTFKKHLVNQICQAAAGPCKYTGKSMKAAHKGLGIKDEHFSALVEDLVKSLDKFKVAEADKNTLLGVLGPMKSDIVEEHAAH